jgi:hypothetical protein
MLLSSARSVEVHLMLQDWRLLPALLLQLPSLLMVGNMPSLKQRHVRAFQSIS